MSLKGESIGSAYLTRTQAAESRPRVGWKSWVSAPTAAVVLSMTFGLTLVFLTAPFQSPGEFQHFYRAYQISEGQWVATYHGGVGGCDLPASLSLTVDRFSKLRFHPQEKTSSQQIFDA